MSNNTTAPPSTPPGKWIPFLASVDQNLLMLEILAVGIVIIAAASNATALILSRRSRLEKTQFMLILEVDCVTKIVGCLVGFLLLNTKNTAQFNRDYTVFISYGLASFLPAHILAVMDGIPFYLNGVTPLMLAFMMIYRALILFEIRLKKQTIIHVIVFCLTSMSPCVVCAFVSYRDIGEAKIFLDNYTREAAEARTSYGVVATAVQFIFYEITTYLTAILFFLVLFLRILMEYKLRKFCAHMSKATRKTHFAFLNLLSFDTLVSFLYFFIRNGDTLVTEFGFTWGPFLQFTIIYNTMSFPMFGLGGVLQGLALLYYVPSFKKAILIRIGCAPFEEETPVVSVQSNTAAVIVK